MKKNKLVLVLAFLTFLYIGPSIFTLVPSAVPTEQNMSKDFSLSEDAWLTGWNYRKAVLIDGSSGAGTNYTVPITVSYSSKMQNDFDDIRFTGPDNITLLDHWRESYTASTTALFWVEIADNLDSNRIISMYYGNDEVSSLSNGYATFLSYEDWSSQSIDAWTVPGGQSDGQTTFSPTGATQGGYVAKVEGDPGDGYLLYTDYAQTAQFATRFRANIEEATAGNTGRMGTGWAGAYGWAFIQTGDPNEIFSVFDDDSNSDHQSMSNSYFDSYVTFEIRRTVVVFFGHAYLYADDVEIEDASFDPDENVNPVCSIQVIDSEDAIYSDWVVCRKLINVEPEFNSFGEEENNFVWHVVIDDAELNFFVPVDETGLNLLLIFLGLCMIPASVLYLVMGGKSGMSNDKFFFGLIAFIMGWALFLGGIYG